MPRRVRSSSAPAVLVAAASLLASCSLTPYPELTEDRGVLCQNGFDDDRDGAADCGDPECAPFCEEDTAAECTNGFDDDADGLADAYEPRCWPSQEIVVGFDRPSGIGRCATRAASALTLAEPAPGAAAEWSFDCEGHPDCSAWEADPVDPTARAVRLHGGPTCTGAGVLDGACDALAPPGEMTGGPCWRAELEVVLGDGAPGLALVLAPGPQRARSALRVAENPAVIDILRGRDPDGSERVLIGYAADGRRAVTSLAPGSGPFDVVHLSVDFVGAAGSCDAGAYGPPTIRARLDGAEAVLERWPAGVPLTAPRWDVNDGLGLAIQAIGPGDAWLRGITLARGSRNPCSFAMPQITSSAGGAVVFSAARGDGTICVLGASAPPLVRTVEYDEIARQGWPPELPEDEEAVLLPRALGSWHVEDRGMASFETVVAGPFLAAAPGAARAGALSWDEATGRFEGVVLLSERPRAGGSLVRVSSADCERWEVTAEAALGAELRAAIPMLLGTDAGGRRLVVATPGAGFEREALVSPVCGAWPALHFAADPVAYVKPIGSRCLIAPPGGPGYGRAALVEARGALGGPLVDRAEIGMFPAFDLWDVSCGASCGLIPFEPRSTPTEVHQVIELGGERALVGTGTAGIEVILDDEEGVRHADAVVLPQALLGPSGIPGTFDTARVTDGRLLVMSEDPDAEAAPLLGFLFYRGFERVERLEADERVVLYGGAVGVIPVRIGRYVAGTDDAGVDR